MIPMAQKKRKSMAKRSRKEVVEKKRSRWRNYFFTGLLITVPLGITFLVLRFLIRIADSVLRVIPQEIHDTYIVFRIPGLGVVITLTLIMVIGILAHNFVGRKLVSFGERIINHIPLVRSVYSASKQLLETIFAGTDHQFQRVVLVEYPRRGVYSIGFVTGKVPGKSAPLDTPQLSVFIPTTPNPTSGWYLIVPEADVVPTALSVEEAFKIIISAGIVMSKDDFMAPKRIAKTLAEKQE